MRRCGICHQGYRGKATRVVTIEGRKLACPTCTSRGFVVVPVGGVSACKCGVPATLCGSCASDRVPKDVGKLVEKATVTLAGRLEAFRKVVALDGTDDFTAGKIEGLEDAVATLRGGRF